MLKKCYWNQCTVCVVDSERFWFGKLSKNSFVLLILYINNTNVFDKLPDKSALP